MRTFHFVAVLIATLVASATPALAGEIHEAIAAGDAARVTTLIRSDPAVVHERDTNQTQDQPMHTVAAFGHIEIARMLLDAGATLEAEDVDGSTPLHVACVRRQADMVAFLIEKGASATRRDHNGAYSLSFAVSGGDTAIVRMLREAGADLFYRGANGFTLMHYAARRGLMAFADTLLAHGEDANIRSAFGETPLHLAARGGDVEMGRFLLKNGADANAGTNHGWNPTPLIYTCWDGHADFAKLLIAHGADVNHVAGEHRALFMAVDNGHTDLVTVLVQNGAEVDATETEFGCTPLHVAAVRGYRDIAEILLDHGAQPTSTNRLGQTPLQLAGRYGHRDMTELLIARGAPGPVPEMAAGPASFDALDDREAIVWFLGHSGWAVKTRSHVLVFDSWQRRRGPTEPGLCNGRLSPPELANERVIVFASHEHGDHYDPQIWELQQEIPNVTYVLGFKPTEEVPEHTYVGPRQTQTVDGVTITTIESNDSGVGFWVEVDGVTLFHPGDHANRQRDFSGPYKKEIDWLAAKKARLDIAFFPISGCGFGDLEAVKLGVYYALETLGPRAFFPMHGGDLTHRYQEFIDDSQPRFPGIHMQGAMAQGDRFHYRNGDLQALAVRGN